MNNQIEVKIPEPYAELLFLEAAEQEIPVEELLEQIAIEKLLFQWRT